MYQANHPITLGEMQIEFTIDGRSVCVPSKAVQKLLPTPQVVIEVSSVPRVMKSGPLLADGPSNVRLENGTAIDVVPLRWVPGQQNAVLPVATAPCVVLKSEEPIAKIQFSILNLSSRTERYPIALQAKPWAVRIDPVTKLRELERNLASDGGYGVTHQGTIERLDGSTFSSDDAQRLLRGLDLFLSFVSGSYCSTTNAIGLDAGGNEAWVRWGSHDVSPWRRRRSWFDITIISSLSEIFSVFWREFKANKKDLARLLQLYVLSNESNIVDVSI